jgi:hypothetical protein
MAAHIYNPLCQSSFGAGLHYPAADQDFGAILASEHITTDTAFFGEKY